jgi:hypothetical protein
MATKAKKNVLTNYIIKFWSGGGFLLHTRRLALDALKHTADHGGYNMYTYVLAIL